MTESVHGAIKVLLFCPRPVLGGGVGSFDKIFRRTIGPGFLVEQFLVGRIPGKMSGMLRPLVTVYDTCRLIRLLIVRSHDVYHLNPSLVSLSVIRDGIFLLVLRIFRRRNVLIFVRGWNEEYYEQLLNSRLSRSVFRYIYGYATRILVLGSQFVANFAGLGLDRDKIFLTSTMFDRDMFSGISRKRDGESITILFMARFVATKGIFELLNGFRAIAADHQNIVLVMAGDGPDLQRARDWCLRSELQKRIVFPGFVSGPEKAQFLLDSDVFALPTYHGEGCPNTLLEAMAAGLPVIVTAVGGIPDIVQDRVNGLVVQPKDSHAVSDAIIELAHNGKMRREMGETNRQIAWQKFESKAVTTAMETHYRGIVSRSVGRRFD